MSLLIKIGRNRPFNLCYLNSGYVATMQLASQIVKPENTDRKNFNLTLMRRYYAPHSTYQYDAELTSCYVPYEDSYDAGMKRLKFAIEQMAATQILLHLSIRGIMETDQQYMVELAQLIDSQLKSVTKQQALDWISR